MVKTMKAIKNVVPKEVICQVKGLSYALNVLNRCVCSKYENANWVKRLYMKLIERLFVKSFLNG